MAKIVDGPRPKRVACHACSATIEYLPEEVETVRHRDYTGDLTVTEQVKCPRPGCPGHGVIRSV